MKLPKWLRNGLDAIGIRVTIKTPETSTDPHVITPPPPSWPKVLENGDLAAIRELAFNFIRITLEMKLEDTDTRIEEGVLYVKLRISGDLTEEKRAMLRPLKKGFKSNVRAYLSEHGHYMTGMPVVVDFVHEERRSASFIDTKEPEDDPVHDEEV